jgi:hypothetical protein
MDTKTLVVDQKVWVFGCGWFEATVVRLLPSGVEVKSEWGQLAQFDNDGNETDDSRYRRLGCLQNGPGTEWGPLELRERDREAEKAQEAKAKEARDAWCERMFSTFYPRPK